MDYYYDVMLNFQERYCMFYEWDKEDDLEYAKKIPLIHVEQKTILNMLSKKIQISKSFLESIKDKTKLKGNHFLEYTSIFSDGKNALAIEFDEEGYSINKSSLILDDELNVNEFMYNISLSNIEYKVIKDDGLIKETRQEEKVKKVIKLEINNMFKDRNYSKLKYIYLEWFDELLEDTEKMYQKMLKKLDESLTEKEYLIYELIKLSYNNV